MDLSSSGADKSDSPLGCHLVAVMILLSPLILLPFEYVNLLSESAAQIPTFDIVSGVLRR